MVLREEVGDRVSVAPHDLLDAVHGGDEAVVGHTHHEIADVDDEGAGDRGRLDPVRVSVQDLETADRVLAQDREGRELDGARWLVFKPSTPRWLQRLLALS